MCQSAVNQEFGLNHITLLAGGSTQTATTQRNRFVSRIYFWASTKRRPNLEFIFLWIFFLTFLLENFGFFF